MEQDVFESSSNGEASIFASLPNTRDLGGMRTANGQRIVSRALLRSGALTLVSSHDSRRLRDDYKPKTIIDLRTESEYAVDIDPSKAFPDTRYINIPLLKKRTLGITKNDNAGIADVIRALGSNAHDLMKEVYLKLLLDKHSQQGFAQFFEELLDAREGAVLWHCAFGKDRTGLATVLLLQLLDVPEKTIVNDYLATNRFAPPRIQATTQEFPLQERTKDVLESIRVFNTVDVSFLQAGFDAIREEYGSLERYMREALDVSPDKRDALRNKYLVD
ncbi:MAG: tyrosine-protein phosphatase [Eggerthellaceae bacterium]|nr:tyrosine-protein phosphatase [Eggerthellaceae bacterium]